MDRKSFFAIAESDNGIDNFRFWDYPVSWETPDPEAPVSDTSSAVAQAGLVRTKDLVSWDYVCL